MKKLLSLLIVFIMIFAGAFSLAACNPSDPDPTSPAGEEEGETPEDDEYAGIEEMLSGILENILAQFGIPPEALEGFDEYLTMASDRIINASKESGLSADELVALLSIRFDIDMPDIDFDEEPNPRDIGYIFVQLDFFKKLKDTGVPSEKLSLFTYKAIEELKTVAEEMGAPEDVLNGFDAILDAVSPEDFVTVFTYFIDVGGMYEPLFNMDFFDLMDDLMTSMIIPSLGDFKTVVKTNLTVQADILSLINDELIDAFGTMIKISMMFNEEWEPGELETYRGYVDEGAALVKEVLPAVRAVYAELADDDVLLEFIYNNVILGKLFMPIFEDDAEDIINTLVIAAVKYVNVLLDNGIDSDTLDFCLTTMMGVSMDELLMKLFEADDISELPFDTADLIAAVQSLKGIEYGDALPASGVNDFVDFFTMGMTEGLLSIYPAGLPDNTDFASAIAITVNERVDIWVLEEYQKRYYSFTVGTTGDYTIMGDNNKSGNSLVWLYDSSETEITHGIYDKDGKNFKITVHLTAGETYYIAAGCFEDGIGYYKLEIKG